MSKFYEEIAQILKEQELTKAELSNLKIKLSKKYHLKKIPTDIEILLNIDPKDAETVRLNIKPTRTISGVAVVTIMTAPIACRHGACTYCPGGPNSFFGNIPMSYTGNEPASMRGIRANWDPYLQVFNRLEQYVVTGHEIDKIELIINGGTFTSFPILYQDRFIAYALKALNDFSTLFYPNGILDIKKFKDFFELPGDFQNPERIKRVQNKISSLKGAEDLEKEKKINESAKARCVALCLETRPDWSMNPQIDDMLRYGTTRVELGVQTLSNRILEITNRQDTVENVIKATEQLKDAFLKVGYHMMPGLPTSSREYDIWMFKELFENSDFKPDNLKVYPCMVMPGTELYKDYKEGKFNPISTEQAAEIIAEAKRYVPEYCRIMRVNRDIPTKVTSAGVGHTNLRQYVEKFLKEKNIECRCIRCREPKNLEIDADDITIKKIKYKASASDEIFIAAESKKHDKHLGFCRLRIPANYYRKEITEKSAGIRELHVYGRALALNKQGALQHRGIGQKLVHEAEKIAKEEYDKNKMLIISGIGVRNYYKNKLGYSLEGPYMVKNI